MNQVFSGHVLNFSGQIFIKKKVKKRLNIRNYSTSHFTASHRKDHLTKYYWIVAVFFAYLVLSFPAKTKITNLLLIHFIVLS